MEPTDELIEALRREEIEDARRLTFSQKFLAGAELFDYACEISKGGIRMQHPNFNDEQVMAELHRRLDLGDRLEGRAR
jgi:hypothetical protein